MSRPLPILRGDRVLLRMAGEEDVRAILAYYEGNRRHLAATSPARPENFHTAEFWTEQARKSLTDFEADAGLRLFMFKIAAPLAVIGAIHLSHVLRGPLQACHVGYTLDEREQGQGLMTEGLRLTIEYAFEEMNLHRIMADHLPDNTRSAALLRRLGFTVEGYARHYLLINGRWQDHVLNSLVNPQWKPA